MKYSGSKTVLYLLEILLFSFLSNSGISIANRLVLYLETMFLKNLNGFLKLPKALLRIKTSCHLK
jgi:hypothetical protein